MANLHVNCIHQTCPVPLVETRKAVRKANKGDIIEVKGTHPSSKKEIPMAAESMGLEVRSIEEEDGIWKIVIRT
ncbi:MAG: sulfurtransferase TusA family protein [Spirochaetota bacterium]